MPSRIRTGAAFAAPFMLACAPAMARDSTAEILVTGRSVEETLPQERARYGSDLVTLEEEAIEDAGAIDLATALAQVPGLYVMPRSGPFSYVDVSMQGARNQDVLWTVDGVRINNRLYATTSPNDTLPASMIERVEVLKGGESLFYGTQASAGVINVVTRSFDEHFGGQANAGVDSFGGTNLDGWVRGGIGRHRFVAWASQNRSEGFRPYSAMEPSATDRRRGYDLWSVGGKYRYELGPDVQFSVHYQHTEARLDNLSPTRVRESRNDRNEEIASVRLDYVGSEAVRFFVKGYYHDWDTSYVSIRNDVTTGEPVVVYPAGTYWGYRDIGGSALARLHFHPGLEYVVGYDFQSFRGRDDVLLIGDSSERVHAGIVQIRTTDELSGRARLAAGLRHNDGNGAKKTVWNVLGRFDVSEAFYAEANGGTAFLLPSASQLYQIDPCCEQGNPDLQPEESIGINFALGGNLMGGAVTWKAALFVRRIDNLIDISYADPGFPEGRYVNVGDRVNIRGVDAQVTARLEEDWLLDASYTYTRSREAGSGIQRDRTPDRLLRARLTWKPAALPFGANLAVNWIGDAWSTVSGFGRRNYGNYAVVNAGIQIYPDGATRRHRLGINVENLLDEDYASRGYSSAARDDGNGRFLYFTRGVPRTLRMTYGVSF